MELVPAASEQEAAAIAAAIARFDADTAPAPAAPAQAQRESRWLRAARLEGVARGAAAAPTWGDPLAGSAGP